MTKKQIKFLMENIYKKDGSLDEETVVEVANSLSRANLKQFISALKSHERKSSVIIKSATDVSTESMKTFQEEYPTKKIDYIVDPSLLIGIEIIDNDMVYNMNLKSRLENMVSHIAEK